MWNTVVAARATIIDGRIMVENWCGKLIPLSQAPQFYVDPRTGRLHRNTAIETLRMRQKRIAAARTSELSQRMRALSPTRQLHRLADGNWWEITLAELDWRASLELRQGDDVVHRAGLSDLPLEALYGRPRVVGTAKRPLSATEIRRYGLRG